MLGHRGCRLCITYPEILEMQVTAIVEAAINCKNKKIDAHAEIMIPLVGTVQELAILRKLAAETIAKVVAAKKFTGKLDILIGTMIEIPRAALTADEVATEADFFSFGTNDLTQMTFGYSRDDINTFLPDYLAQEILENDPFQSLDTTGVGQLVTMAVEKGRKTNPKTEARHLRRARRRPRLDPLLPRGRPGLRVLLPVPRADRPPGRGPGGPGFLGQLGLAPLALLPNNAVARSGPRLFCFGPKNMADTAPAISHNRTLRTRPSHFSRTPACDL